VENDEGRVSPPLSDASGGGCLGAAATSCGRPAGHLSGAVVAEIGLLGAAPGVGIGQAERRAFTFTDFLPAIVTDQYGFPSHVERLL
jgi:hypothetical protein